MSTVDFFRKRLIAEKHLQLTIECHENYCRAYSKHRFVCTVDGKPKNTSRFAMKF